MPKIEITVTDATYTALSQKASESSSTIEQVIRKLIAKYLKPKQGSLDHQFNNSIRYILTYFAKRFKEHTKVEYVWSKKDVMMIRTLVKKSSPQAVLDRIDILFDHPPKWLLSRDVSMLVTHFNKLVNELDPTLTGIAKWGRRQ